VRQLLTESLLLALCSGILAFPLIRLGIGGLIAIAPATVPGIAAATLDVRTLAFATLLVLLTTLLFGVLPAFATARVPGDALKSSGRTIAGPQGCLRPALIVTELALSLVLVIGASLLAKSFFTVMRTPLGFHAENVLTMRLSLPDTRYGERQRVAFVEQITRRCAALPGVITAAVVSSLPLTGEAEGWGLRTEDNPNDWTMLRVRSVTPDYFRTLGIGLRSGRAFTRDDRGSPPVAILSETGARKLWPGMANPVGRRLMMHHPMTLVGIVDDTRASGLDSEIHPYLYIPFAQFATEDFAVTVRGDGHTADLAAAVKSAIWSLDKDEPITHVALMRQLVSDSVAPRRLPALLMIFFAAFALLLAAVGTYSVVAYSVAQRSHEIGIRMALGASRREILARVIARADALALAGVVVGWFAASVLMPLLRSQLYGVNAAEISIFATSALGLVAVASLAALIPALRAARVDPAVCLRYE
jgi:putative ABC transport system permease protein